MTLTDFLDSEFVEHPHLLLIGNPVEKSLSPLMHNAAARYFDLDLHYHAVRTETHELKRLGYHFTHPKFRGANVTIPHKRVLTEYVDELDPVAKRVGALNTILNSPTKLFGYNTDVFGFTVPLKPYQDQILDKRVIIFGTGGAARAIVQAVDNLGAKEIVLVSRNPEKDFKAETKADLKTVAYGRWPEYGSDAVLLVNATPLGMRPRIDESPVAEDQQKLLEDKICYDIVYKPLKTKFLRLAGQAGSVTIGGLEMLIYQASQSFKIWTGKTFPVEYIKDQVHEHLGTKD